MEDLTFGEDVRGDYALFIEGWHIQGWEIDEHVKAMIEPKEFMFFRVLQDGEQTHLHGWIENGKIAQWG